MNTPPPQEEYAAGADEPVLQPDVSTTAKQSLVDYTYPVSSKSPVGDDGNIETTVTTVPKVTEEAVDIGQATETENGKSSCATKTNEANFNNSSAGQLETKERYDNICVALESKELWSQFDAIGTEMIITKAGR